MFNWRAADTPTMRSAMDVVLLILGFAIGRFSSIPAVCAQAQTEAQPITVGGATIRIGMSKDQVISQFGSEYKLIGPTGADSFIVSQTLRPGGAFEMLASLSFKGGRLNWVSKSWVSDQQSVESFWRGLYGSTSTLTGSHSMPVSLSTESHRWPGGSVESISVMLDGRTINISRIEDDSASRTAYDVSEEFK